MSDRVAQRHGNPQPKERGPGKQKDSEMTFPEKLTINDKDRPKVISDDPVTKFDLSRQSSHHKPDHLGSAVDFFNEPSRKFESNEK
jgi:hypothetical protein